MFLVSHVAVCYSQKYKFVVVGYSDVASFLNCCSSVILFAPLKMNEVKLKNPSLLNGTLVD